MSFLSLLDVRQIGKDEAKDLRKMNGNIYMATPTNMPLKSKAL